MNYCCILSHSAAFPAAIAAWCVKRDKLTFSFWPDGKVLRSLHIPPITREKVAPWPQENSMA
eukprot:1162043-Pelagomonas_calceolata.AAC.7